MNDYPEGMPCWAPGAAEHLAELLTGKEIGWEWGGGASSVWLAPQIAHLHVVEHTNEWCNFVIQRTKTHHCTVHLHSFDSPHYLDVVELVDPRPTLWLIDGYHRIDCLALVERKAKTGDLVVADDALDYAEHLLEYRSLEIERFAMPHPHAGIPCVSAKNSYHRNTRRTHAPETKETWIWRA